MESLAELWEGKPYFPVEKLTFERGSPAWNPLPSSGREDLAFPWKGAAWHPWLKPCQKAPKSDVRSRKKIARQKHHQEAQIHETGTVAGRPKAIG